ncbi:MAG: arginine decarboxylase, pyruvoyl-dependent [Candidatus Marsarchaeota archaeon]|jgi:arginine decarboxylase|nr:arginine decarboxylase, pyruvoyl-dependent [Candidatus Marsarchaeota archaeon]
MNGNIVPKKVFFTKGVGRAKMKLEAFEFALRDAGIEKFNLVRVSSIIPPNCEIIAKEEGLKMLNAGGITFLVLARLESDEEGVRVTSSVGLAVPKDRSNYGYLSEHEEFGSSKTKAGDKAEELAATMLASTLGIKFNAKHDWKRKKQIIKISNKIIRTDNITESAAVEKEGEWTCVVAAAVFIL